MAENPENRFVKISEVDIENIKPLPFLQKQRRPQNVVLNYLKVRKTCIQQFTLPVASPAR